MADKKNWLQLLAYVTGSINQELLLRNAYLVAENHILKSQIKGRLRLSDGERATLAGIAKRLGRKALQEVACIAKPDTIIQANAKNANANLPNANFLLISLS